MLTTATYTSTPALILLDRTKSNNKPTNNAAKPEMKGMRVEFSDAALPKKESANLEFVVEAENTPNTTFKPFIQQHTTTTTIMAQNHLVGFEAGDRSCSWMQGCFAKIGLGDMDE